MDLEEIKTLNVPSLMAPDCIVYLWTTAPKLADALDLLKAWGLTYKSDMVWVKDRMGMGYWARQRHELLLIGVRGTPIPPEASKRPDSVVEAPRGRHSQKPDSVYELLEDLYPSVPRIELFARERRPGWDSWGNE